MTIVAAALCVATPAGASQYVYPAKGQGPKTQASDESACTSWATSKTGYDPSVPHTAPVASAAPVTGSGARLKGAALGAGMGAIAGNAGAGAAGGALAGGMARRHANREQAEAQNNASAQQLTAKRDEFDRARAACLTGKGYTVK